MPSKEAQACFGQLLYVYKGLLAMHPEFTGKKKGHICYELDCPEYAELREKYRLAEIAGKGGQFARAKRLLHYLAPRLTHSSYYDNHVQMDALHLLEYSLDRPDQGINCLNKSKILEECCLALGIYARRMFMMPYSPYDTDNHVVTEIYDTGMRKWIALDPSMDTYFVDEAGTPLSLLEVRERFAGDAFVTAVKSAQRKTDLQAVAEKMLEENAYYAKNCFYFGVDAVSTFGTRKEGMDFLPAQFDLNAQRLIGSRFRYQYCTAHAEAVGEGIVKWAKERYESMKNTPPAPAKNYDISALTEAPADGRKK